MIESVHGGDFLAAAPTWGADPSRIGGWALADAPAVLRLLLPARLANDEPIGWAAVSEGTWRTNPVDGYTDWHALTEFPGDGRDPGMVIDHPAGRMSAPMVATLKTVSLLTDARWHLAPDPDDDISFSVAPLTADGPVPAVTVRTRLIGETFADLSADWTRRGFRGRAWTDDGRIGIAAPAYADSLIVSGPVELAEALFATDLEVFAVARTATLPITTD